MQFFKKIITKVKGEQLVEYEYDDETKILKVFVPAKGANTRLLELFARYSLHLTLNPAILKWADAVANDVVKKVVDKDAKAVVNHVTAQPNKKLVVIIAKVKEKN